MTARPPQINVRVPTELKEQIHKAAELNGRSVNSEIVNRLEQSLILHSEPERLITAQQAKLMALQAQQHLFENLKIRSFTAINDAIKLGKLNTVIDISYLEIEDETDQAVYALVQPLRQLLIELGYVVSELNSDSIFVEFK